MFSGGIEIKIGLKWANFEHSTVAKRKVCKNLNIKGASTRKLFLSHNSSPRCAINILFEEKQCFILKIFDFCVLVIKLQYLERDLRHNCILFIENPRQY